MATVIEGSVRNDHDHDYRQPDYRGPLPTVACVECGASKPVDVSVTTLQLWRCWKCGNLLAQINMAPGSVVQSKCKCNAWNIARTYEAEGAVVVRYTGSTDRLL